MASIKDLAPANTLEELKEFAIYPSCWSLPHHAAALLDRSAISRIFNEEFQCLTNSFGENMFTLAVERGDPEITNEVLKSFSQFSAENIGVILGEIPVDDLMWYMNS